MTGPAARADLVLEWFDDAALVLSDHRVTRLDLASAAFLVALDGTEVQDHRIELAAALGDEVDGWIEGRLGLFRRLGLLTDPPP